MRRHRLAPALLAAAILALAFHEDAAAQEKKPNILVIFGDNIGVSNVSCYSDGLMGYDTPNIDRIAKEGMKFLHYYAEQSCTAGRAAFLTGQHGIRTGLTKVGFPGAPMGVGCAVVPRSAEELGSPRGPHDRSNPSARPTRVSPAGGPIPHHRRVPWPRSPEPRGRVRRDAAAKAVIGVR